MVKLQNLLKNWSQSRHLFFADEQGGTPMAEALSAHAGPAAFLIGPEGGFDEEERVAIRAHPAAVPVSLGPRILRAETAAIRSEEHTSELQSLMRISYAVFCLKKKTNNLILYSNSLILFRCLLETS